LCDFSRLWEFRIGLDHALWAGPSAAKQAFLGSTIAACRQALKRSSSGQPEASSASGSSSAAVLFDVGVEFALGSALLFTHLLQKHHLVDARRFASAAHGLNGRDDAIAEALPLGTAFFH
jgi:hypothetical protein